jgi:general secretion pathway protein K
MGRRETGREKGGALLAVLWLTAALMAIAFSVANTVRGETERTGTASEGIRTYYLATGSIDRALLYMQWGPDHRNPDGTPKFWEKGMSRVNFAFPSGVSTVEFIPESSKLSLNAARPEELTSLMVNLGVDPGQAEEITAAIVDWRTSMPAGPFDEYYLSRTPSFRPRHASFEELEELLLVKGMTPELFYGSFARDPQGRLYPRSGMKNCVSVYGTGGPVDVNSAEPAVLATVGLGPEAISAIVERRHANPFKNYQDLVAITQGAGSGHLQIGGGTIYTVRATAQLRLPAGGLSDLRRTVSAMVKLREPGYNPPIEILRWYDN